MSTPRPAQTAQTAQTAPAPHALTVITGHSRGVGAALAAQCLARGDQVLGIARQPLRGPPAAAGERLIQWQADLAEPLALAQRLQDFLAAQDPARISRLTLINNAGLLTPPGPLQQASALQAAAALRVGLEAAVLLTQALLAACGDWPCRKQVLNVSSGLGRRAMAGSAVYCAAKAGLDHFTRALALEQAGRPHPVALASIAPGVIDTDMQRQLRGADPARFADQPRFAALHDQGQLLSAEACATLLLQRLDRSDFGREPVGDVRDPA